MVLDACRDLENENPKTIYVVWSGSTLSPEFSLSWEVEHEVHKRQSKDLTVKNCLKCVLCNQVVTNKVSFSACSISRLNQRIGYNTLYNSISIHLWTDLFSLLQYQKATSVFSTDAK